MGITIGRILLYINALYPIGCTGETMIKAEGNGVARDTLSLKNRTVFSFFQDAVQRSCPSSCGKPLSSPKFFTKEMAVGIFTIVEKVGISPNGVDSIYVNQIFSQVFI